MFLRTISTGFGIKPQPYNPSSPQKSGAIYWDSIANSFKLVDSNGSEFVYPFNTTVELDDATKNVIEWARHKMVEERKLLELCAKNEAVKQAVDDLHLIIAMVK